MKNPLTATVVYDTDGRHLGATMAEAPTVMGTTTQLPPVRAEPVDGFATARVRDVEMGPLDHNLVPFETQETCDQQCWNPCCSFCCSYAVVMVIGLFVALVIPFPVGVFILSLLPAVVISFFAYKWYEPYVTRCSMHVVFFESALYLLVPLLIFITVIDLFIGLPDNCEADENSDRDWAAIFVQAFLRAGLLEEIVKYMGFRRIMWRPYITDARALLVYSCLSGVSFGVIENIGYGLLGGPLVVFYRSFLTVFAHATTGLLMGTYLAEARFVEGAQEKWPWYRVLVIPVLGHGIYDVLLFINAGFCTPPLLSLVFAAMLFLLAGIIFTRYRFAQVLKICPQTNVNVHERIANGEIPKPCLCSPGCFDCYQCCY